MVNFQGTLQGTVLKIMAPGKLTYISPIGGLKAVICSDWGVAGDPTKCLWKVPRCCDPANTYKPPARSIWSPWAVSACRITSHCSSSGCTFQRPKRGQFRFTCHTPTALQWLKGRWWTGWSFLNQLTALVKSASLKAGLGPWCGRLSAYRSCQEFEILLQKHLTLVSGQDILTTEGIL